MRTQSNILSKSILTAVFLCYFSLNQAPAQITNIISPTNLTAWIPGVTVGVLNGIPTGETIFTNMTGLDNTGATDCSGALQSAINLASASGWMLVVQVPAGTFKLAATINPASGVILRGAGMTNTIFNFSGGHFEKQYSSYSGWNAGQVVTGVLAGTTNINVSDTSGFGVYAACMITEFNSASQYDNPLVTGVGVPSTSSDSGYAEQFVRRVVAKTSSTITVWPPIPCDMTARTTKIIPMPIMGLNGFENFTMNTGDQKGIYLVAVRDSWVKNVKINGAANEGINIEQGVGCEVDGCWVSGQTNSSPNGAGILLVSSSAGLYQNNVILNYFPCIEMFGGNSGNVVAYNFLLNANNLLELDSNHNPHNSFNLYEGNVCPRFMSDGYYGSTAQDTVFRNWFNGQQTGTTQMSYCFALERFTRDYSVVGNVFGSGAPYYLSCDGTSYGNPNMGNGYSSGFAPQWADWGTSPGATGFQELDTNVLQTTLLAGNYYYFTNGIPVSQSLGTKTLPASLYLASAPPWWGTNRWPAIDPYATPKVTMIPAEQAYLGLSSGFGNPPVSSGGGIPAPPADLHPMVATAP